MERDDRLLTSLPLSHSPAASCLWWSVFICLSDCRCLTHRADQTPPHGLHDLSAGTQLGDYDLTWQYIDPLGLPPLVTTPQCAAAGTTRRWEASVCKCWVWTINYVDFAYRGRNLTLFDTDFLKRCDEVKQPYKHTSLSKQLNQVYLHWCDYLNTQLLHIVSNTWASPNINIVKC